ncbi:MAG: dTDP-glucose 4,6-dehydratase [bacterium]|nr:dTDP-glucose 4,6-dehydratase [bacterium]MDW8163234.1 dTDP-glucose 4,6-dehydratase [Candidatus Omnitrophota bacterium]
MNIVVTGGAGFIGSNFIKYIFKRYPEYKILNIDKLTYAGNLENLKEIEKNPNYKFLKKDICDRDLEEFLDGYDVIINFAAESHVDRAIYGPEEFLKTDIFGTFNLLEIAKKKNIKFIQISTDEVYGSIEEGSFDENSPLNPSNPYSSSKASADLITISYFKTYKVPTNIIRSCNNYGPNQYPEKFIPLMITNAIENKKLPIYGDGLYRREWIYVIDNCKAIDLVLHKGKEGEIYNVSSEFSIPNIEIAKKILNLLGKDESLIEFVKDRPGHDRRYSIKCEKIKKLGWHIETDFEKGIELTVKWYIENKNWWRIIKESPQFITHYKKTYNL